jgi:hypothetical protein
MPPIILWALGAVGAAVIGRFVMKEARRINAELHPEPVGAERDVQRLERDPKTGIYRPK